ncbi:ECF transporter S component [Liquorilactobacillus hordei]|uniref:ECF transporter S component n=1 Tax=Liquorilactobacillus hordei TaxID=468911 RepID=UPI001CBDD03F|nr:ECF transporter S component [Liquorilactobacillus hordei]MBZ2404893.1 ECF transporter S component [Liquorilactobacillus hordei]
MVYTATRRYVISASLAGVSYLLMFLSFVVVPLVPYMKVDFSDLPILFGMFILGPLGGIEIALIRSILYFIISGPSIDSLIGVTTNFFASMTLTLPIFYTLRKKYDVNIWNILRSILFGTISLTVILSLANYLVIMPIYMKVLGMNLSMPLAKFILIGVVPFNLIKGLLVGTAFWILFVKMKDWIVKQSVVLK